MMHNRIRDFEKQSGLEIFGLGAKRHIWEAALEKYADLVVQECMSNLHLNGYDDAMMQIKQHFGMNPNEITTAMLDATIAQCEQELAKKKHVGVDQ